jgi:hypothetical protein
LIVAIIAIGFRLSPFHFFFLIETNQTSYRLALVGRDEAGM